MRANFQYTQLVERKAELALELSRAELQMHERYGPHGQYDPDYSIAGETLRQKRERLDAEYDSVCSQIDLLKQDMRRQGYDLTHLAVEASTVRG